MDGNGVRLDGDVPRRPARVLDFPSAAVGESPRWFRGSWWWVDTAAGEVFRAGDFHQGSSAVERLVDAGRRISVVLPATGGRTLLAVDRDLIVVADDNEPELWTTVQVPEGMLLNDAAVDAAGSVWIGSVDPDGRANGELVRIGPDRRQQVMAAGFRMSNGMAFETGGALLHADSTARQIVRHERSVDGAVVESTPYLQFAEQEGLPDGLEIDALGGLWVALYGSGSLRHYTVSGLLDDVVEVATPQVTNVALGGPDGHDMLITTADEPSSSGTRDPLAGRLFAARARTPAPRRRRVQL
jgi:sugar lactone lactonase YvrE